MLETECGQRSDRVMVGPARRPVGGGAVQVERVEQVPEILREESADDSRHRRIADDSAEDIPLPGDGDDFPVFEIPVRTGLDCGPDPCDHLGQGDSPGCVLILRSLAQLQCRCQQRHGLDAVRREFPAEHFIGAAPEAARWKKRGDRGRIAVDRPAGNRFAGEAAAVQLSPSLAGLGQAKPDQLSDDFPVGKTAVEIGYDGTGRDSHGSINPLSLPASACRRRGYPGLGRVSCPGPNGLSLNCGQTLHGCAPRSSSLYPFRNAGTKKNFIRAPPRAGRGLR